MIKRPTVAGGIGGLNSKCWMVIAKHTTACATETPTSKINSKQGIKTGVKQNLRM